MFILTKEKNKKMEEKKRKKIVQQFEKTETIIDKETGEIKQESTTTFSKLNVEQEPSFVKLYIEDLSRVIGLSKTSNDAVLCLLRRMDYDNIISLNAYVRKLICDDMGIKPNTLSHILEKLTKSNVLKKIGSNTFEMNPFLYGKGKWEKIRELRMTFTYNENGRTIEMDRLNDEEFESLNGIEDETKKLIKQMSETMMQVLKKPREKRRAIQLLD